MFPNSTKLCRGFATWHLRRVSKLRILLIAGVLLGLIVSRADQLSAVWNQPPRDAQLRAYWWWLNGNVTKQSITRDLEQMKAKGFGGALICDADGSSQDGNDRAPHGPTFFSPAWRELYRHTLREADRLGLEMSLNIQSGWNLGGPMVTQEDAPKKLVWTEVAFSGGSNISLKLPKPGARDNFYRDLFVLAYRVNPNLAANRKGIANHAQKALHDVLRPFSAPNTQPLFAEQESGPNEWDTTTKDVMDLTMQLKADGVLQWQAPAGNWVVLRIGCTLNDHCRVSTCSEGWDGYALDPFDAGAFKRYWDAVVEPLIDDAGPLAGKTLKYLHTDSWEVEVANWTPTLREEFRKRRGYDFVHWLPVMAGKIVNSREESNRFLHDFRRTMGDLAMDNHFKLFKEWSHRRGLLIHPESGGPHAVPIDAQQALGFNDAPMSEFWAWSWRHRMGDANRFFVKQPASAAHTYGRKLVLAEGFTTIGPHWQETIWDNLKPSFDFACTEGLNLLVWHAFVCSPESEGIPGQQYFAGTHLNPLVTWWDKAKPFFDYINRCQALLQQGLPVADVAYYYGNHVPNFSQLRSSDPAKVGPGFDYDVVTEEVILQRMKVANGRIVLPDGMSYRLLVLPDRDIISLPVLRKLKELVRAGATIVGPKPSRSMSLQDFPKQDREVQKIAAELWSGKVGRGRVVANQTAREVLLADGVKPDCTPVSPVLNYIHRRDGDVEIYFVASRTNIASSVDCGFRVEGKVAELWNPVTGERRITASKSANGQTMVSLNFDPYGAWFVVFRSAPSPGTLPVAGKTTQPFMELTGPWTVRFDTNWGGPAEVQFESLISWPQRPESGIQFYSGTATYEKTIHIDSDLAAGAKWVLDLGNVRELAEVKLNGQLCGITWTPPFRVDVSNALKVGTNTLQIEVVNFWPNRIIGDARVAREQQRTRTNIRKLTRDTKLMESGLMGPVWLLEEKPTH